MPRADAATGRARGLRARMPWNTSREETTARSCSSRSRSAACHNPTADATDSNDPLSPDAAPPADAPTPPTGHATAAPKATSASPAAPSATSPPAATGADASAAPTDRPGRDCTSPRDGPAASSRQNAPPGPRHTSGTPIELFREVLMRITPPDSTNNARYQPTTPRLQRSPAHARRSGRGWVHRAASFNLPRAVNPPDRPIQG